MLVILSPLASQDNERADDLATIEANIKQFSTDLVAGDFEAVAEAYTEDAKLFPGGDDILHGREAILGYWTPAADQEGRVTHHQVMPEEITITGSTAYDWGYYEGVYQDGEGKNYPFRGKYVIVWHLQEDGAWKIYLDIWNRIAMEEISD